ncbi:glycosyltransferase [Nostoc sp. TCL26-01]|uniref:glycosyltransferase n=1 Tax=Nostoc sp. TCL26-01 TaxID=2576904 RepID=UPI0015B9C30B|nr:glycosyltransferase [Nostoc sp. TCL26-01]QLE56092.1 glycosyltransferase family 4 protein [Nostoc sp. TCL26-01]
MASVIKSLLFQNHHTVNHQSNTVSKSQSKPTLFCITHDLPPLKTPIANRAKKLLGEFEKTWKLNVLTGTKNADLSEEASISYAKNLYPKFLIDLIGRLRLEKLLTLLIWPDPDIFWVLPAIIKGYRIIQKQRPDAIFVMMMPYSAGLVGIVLKWLTGLPLVLSLDDSLSCTDMHSSSASWLHHHLEHWLEDFYVRQADAVVYVSQFNLDIVKNRQPYRQQSKLHLVRCGADPADFSHPISTLVTDRNFEIIYTGGMNGWYEFYHRPEEKTLAKKLYKAWMELGYYHRTTIDTRSSSPVFAGHAIQEVLAKYPEWNAKIQLKVYGNSFPEFVVQRVLENQNLQDVVSVSGTLPHFQAIQLARQADLLFITLPNRPDGTSGGRISCKTYEYLMTDRPILAAVPKGENWDYLQDKPGVWLVEPTDIEAMNKVIATVASAKFAGSPLRFNRQHLQSELSYINLVQDYLKIFDTVRSRTINAK